MYSLFVGQFNNSQYLDFQRAWYMQPSSASMSRDGERTKCSDIVDATGRYVWRENGVKNGRCCGIDFQQAGQKWRANKCSSDDPVCLSAGISAFVPFAYDAGIALAHGLDKLRRTGLSPDNITAGRLSEAMRQSTFQGVTGEVSFLDNGDRRVDDLEYIVYNYHATARHLLTVGRMVNGSFVPCEGADCARMIFSDGSSRIPDVLVCCTPKGVFICCNPLGMRVQVIVCAIAIFLNVCWQFDYPPLTLINVARPTFCTHILVYLGLLEAETVIVIGFWHLNYQ